MSRAWVATAGVVLASSIAAPVVSAQHPVETNGLHGSIGTGLERLNVSNRSTSHMVTAVEIGARLRVPWWSATSRVSITPHVTLGITSLRGIGGEDSLERDFAYLDRGVQVAARFGPVRPYVFVRNGKKTMERLDVREPSNYVGSGNTFGAGIEIPWGSTVWGQGFYVAASFIDGRFTSIERRGNDDIPASLPFTAGVVHLGWGGRFRGASLLFK